jgi:hypothetical protein
MDKKTAYCPSGSDFQEATWTEVKNEVKVVNSQLFALLETIDPGEKLTFIKASYPFGSTILNDGIVHLPNKKGISVRFDSSDIPEKFQKKLRYTSVPLTLLLNKGCEVFVPLFDRIIPLNLLEPGSVIFGLFEAAGLLSGLTSNPPWCVTAGARSIFMLPKITDQTGHKRLKQKFQIPPVPPRSLADHWEIFSGIANHPDYINQWHCDLLYFTDSWFDQAKNGKKLESFYNYLFKQFTQRIWYLLNETEMNLTWQYFAVALSKRNLRPRPHLINTLKHLIVISQGGLPAFSLGDSSQRLAPTEIIQQEYIETYGLKRYIPTIITPYKLGFCNEHKPIYYSLSFPTLSEMTPDYKAPIPIIDDLRELKLMIETFRRMRDHEKKQYASLDETLTKKNFEFFHSGGDVSGEILDTEELGQSDTALAEEQNRFQNRTFCASGPFLSGCIKIESIGEI